MPPTERSFLFWGLANKTKVFGIVFCPPIVLGFEDMELADLEREICDETGSLVPTLIAGILEIEVDEVTAAIGFDEADSLANYRSESAQTKLKEFRDICFGLIIFDGDRELFAKWLRAPNEELPYSGDKRMCPLDAIKMGKPQWLAGWIRDAFDGNPNRRVLIEAPSILNSL